MNSTIIIGGNHHNTLGVIRALGYKGIQSLLLLITDETEPYVSYSKYIHKCIILKSKHEIVPWLLDYSKSITEKAIILSCADFVTAELDNSYDLLQEHFYLPTANCQGACNHYMNKDTMAILAQDVDINIPKSCIVEPNKPVDISRINIPCIVKPLASIYGSKAQIRIFDKKDLLLTFLNKHKEKRFIIQEYIDKNFEYQLIGCSLNHGEDIIIPGYSKCIRPCPGTNTGFLEYKPFGNFDCNLTACKEFIKRIGYQGLFSMEFLRDKNGNDYFMEINMRNDGNGICVTGAGVNLPYIWYQYCIGGNYGEEVSNVIKDIFVMPEFDDLMLLLKRKVSLITWLKDYKRTTTFMEYCDKDPKPYYVRRRQFIKYMYHKLLGVFKLKIGKLPLITSD